MKTTKYQRGFIGFLVRITGLLFVPACIALVLFGAGTELMHAYYRTVERNCWFGYSDGSPNCQLKYWSGMKFPARQDVEPLALQPFPRVKKESNEPWKALNCGDLAIDRSVEHKAQKIQICLNEALYAAALTYNRALREEKYHASFSNSPSLAQAKESRQIAAQIYDTLLKVAEKPERDWLAPVSVAGVKTTPYVLREVILPSGLASKRSWNTEVFANGSGYKFLSAQLLQQKTQNW